MGQISIPQSPIQICWAESLGDCSKEGSREHPVSQSLFRGKTICASGLSFSAGQTVELSKSAFKTNVLCKKHNNALSVVDQAGTSAFRILENLFGPWPGKNNKIDGPMLERWLLKTMINLELVNDFMCRPPRELVEIAYGKRLFAQDVGLFMLKEPHFPVVPEERIGYTRVLENATTNIIGGRFNFYGCHFLLSFPRPQPATFTFLEPNGDVITTDLAHRPPRIKRDSHSVELSW